MRATVVGFSSFVIIDITLPPLKQEAKYGKQDRIC